MRKFAYVLCLVLGACDDGGASQPDAAPGTPDAAPTVDADQAMPDAGPGTLTVTVHDEQGAPMLGADVVVHNPDGTVKSHTTTDAAGVATPEVNPGDMVTAHMSFQTKGTERRLVTWVGVKPGDQLLLNRPRPPFSSLGTMTVTLPGQFPGVSTTYEASSGSCSASAQTTNPATQLVYELYSPCNFVPASIPVLVTARNTFGQLIAYGVTAGVPVVAMAASFTFNTWRTDFLPFSSDVNNLPGAGEFLDRRLAVRDATGQLFELPFQGLVGFTDTSSTEVPMDLGPSWVYAESVQEGSGARRWRLLSGAMPVPANVTLDYATELPATVATCTFDNTDLARFGTTWSYAADGSTTQDAVLLQFQLNLSDYGTWQVMLPGTATSFMIPALPEAMMVTRPTQLPYTTKVVTIDSAVVDYDGIRRFANGEPIYSGVEDVWPDVLPPVGAGSARLSERDFNPGS